MVSKKIKQITFLVFRIVFSISILLFIFTKIDIKHFIEGIKRINPFFIMIAFLFYWITLLFLSARWKLLLSPFLSKRVSTPEIFRVYMLGMLINTLTPATMGVDISRGLILSGHSSGKTKGFATVVVDRIAGMLGIFFLAVTCILLQYRSFSNKNLLIYFSLFFIIILMGMILIFFPFFKKIMEVMRRRIKIFRAGERLYDFYEAIYSYRDKLSLIIYAFLISILLQMTFSFQALFVGKSFGLNTNILTFISFVPVINALNFLPVTISGLGLREAGFFILFKNYISKEDAILISLFYWFVSTAGNLPALYYLFKNPLKRREK